MEGGWSPGGVAVLRTGLSALLLLVPTLWVLRGGWRPVRGSALGIVLLGSFGIAGTVLCFFNAVSMMPVGVALMIQYTSPVMVLVWVWVRHGLRPQVVTVVGAVVAMGGLVLVVGAMGVDSPPVAGVAWALGGAVCLATYFMTSDQVSESVPPTVLAFAGLVVATLTVGVVGLLRVVPIDVATSDVALGGATTSWWVPLGLAAVVATVFPYVTSMAAVAVIGARLMSFVALSELIAAVLVAWVLLDEQPASVQLVGGLLILAGVVLIRMDRSERIRHAVKADDAHEPFVADPS